MVEKALYNALDNYNFEIGQTNHFDQNWGSVFNFIDFIDTELLKTYTNLAADKEDEPHQLESKLKTAPPK
jgi:hypothetical protein